MGISVVIHTYNADKYLEECLQSVSSVEEIIICDMHSTDRTIEIAQKYGCKIIYHENLGFADPARNFALSHATQDWVLVVDADEIITKELLDYLREVTQKPDCPDCYQIPRKNYVFGKFMRSLYPNCILRFFRRGNVSFSKHVHCTPDEIKGKEIKIDPKREELAMIHYNYDTVASFMSRTNTYTSLEIEKMVKRGFKFSLKFLIFRPLGEFIKRYFLKSGYKDGLHGFIVAYLLAMYETIAIIKLWEYEKNQKLVKKENPVPEKIEETVF
ncbi:MAG: Glycosyl transferase, family 2 [uncultured bacterium]|nr:MAG: Glycosyl transferase, family 2 [uncultured bacterium]